MRYDPQPAILERDGQTLPTDPLLEQTLWFVDPAFGAISLVELPQRLTWSADRIAVTVSRRPFQVALENGSVS